jgi:sterol desaturase/sphingolipid hydroxylase (fatty acid hydroxylase superfamily)
MEIEPFMEKPFVSNEDESVRLFKKDFLEFLTKVHPATPLIVFVPVIIFFMARGLRIEPVSSVLLYFTLGLIFWTFFEYLLHRFLFHYEPKGDFTRRLHYLFHGIHHAYPRDSRRLVMPPSVGIPLATLIYFAMTKLLPIPVVPSFFSGFMLGYLCYDMIHFGIHHFNFNNSIWQEIKKHHLRHHYGDHEKNFGVSSPLWDFIFRT